MLWATLAIIPFVMLQMVTHLFRPSADNFKMWAGGWSRVCLFFAGVRVRRHGWSGLPKDQPYVFVCNHQTGLDIWVNLVSIGHPFGFVAKASLRRVPFLGQALRFSPCLFVDRSTARRAAASIKEAASRIRGGTSVLIYPEGQRTWSSQTTDFMKGAYQLAVKAGVPLVPVALINAYEVYDERSKVVRPGVVHTVVGEPVDTAHLTASHIPELMERTRKWIQECVDQYHRDEAPPFKTGDVSVSSPVN
jgi:1-acyl-sn-glycerol-3-phosphate acyltransferase